MGIYNLNILPYLQNQSAQNHSCIFPNLFFHHFNFLFTLYIDKIITLEIYRLSHCEFKVWAQSSCIQELQNQSSSFP